MYIEKTTAAERLIIEETVGPVFAVIERANEALLATAERFFGDWEQKEIDKDSAEEISNILYLATDAIFDAILEYSLIVGHYDSCGVRPHLDGAENAQQAAQVEKLLGKINDVETRKRIMSMPDSEAITILREIIKGKTTGGEVMA